MISDFFDATLTVYRMAWQTDGSGNQYSSMSSQGTIKGHVQQADAELVEHLGLSFTKAFSIWVSTLADVQEGDELRVDSWVYHVRNKQDFTTGRNKHVQLVCEREREEV